jgi:Protein of unknown function (DUF938)
MPAAEAFRAPPRCGRVRRSSLFPMLRRCSEIHSLLVRLDKDSVKNGPGMNFQGGNGDLSIAQTASAGARRRFPASSSLMHPPVGALPPGSLLFLHCPHIREGIATAPSNQAFDRSLRDRNPNWGLRDLEAVPAIGRSIGFSAAVITEMTATIRASYSAECDRVVARMTKPSAPAESMICPSIISTPALTASGGRTDGTTSPDLRQRRTTCSRASIWVTQDQRLGRPARSSFRSSEGLQATPTPGLNCAMT